MRVAAIGDNCIDYYKNLDRSYVTGNVVDTAVNLKKLGIDTSIISTTGSDLNGKRVCDVLKKEGVDISHLKVKEGKAAITYMELNGLERVHGEYIEGVLENIKFDEDDINFACRHDLVHSAYWGKADKYFKEIKEKGILISFDYATNFDSSLVKETEKYVDFGFFSFKDITDEVKGYLKERVNKGMKIAIATFGEKGSLAWDGNEFYRFGIIPTNVVNTVGAGDSFIAGFIYGILTEKTIEECLKEGAKISSKVVSVFEPWVLN